MAGPSSLISSIPPLPTKPSSSNLTTTSLKLKTLLQTFIFSHMYRVIARALNKAKAILVHLFDDIHFIKKATKHNNPKKIFFGSFRLYYNWCSSHAIPNYACNHHHGEFEECSGELSRYLQWLEEKGEGEVLEDYSRNEIDRLADLFIANCHEKFRLEKEDSYRMFQEMMARSV